MVALKFMCALFCGLAYAAQKIELQTKEKQIKEESLRHLNPQDICGLAPLARNYYLAIHSKPWMALLMNRKKSYFTNQQCAGTLITNTYVLTSAGCVHRFESANNIEVRLGDHHITQEKYCTGEACERDHEDFGVDKIIVHKDYNPSNSQNDIALVKLSKDVKFKDHIRPICLPTSEKLFEEAISGDYFTVNGWGSKVLFRPFGLLKNEGSYHAGCNISDSQIFSNSRSYFETGVPLTNTLYALDMPAIQIGIVSHANYDSQTSLKSTNVARYISWISDTIEE